MTQQIRETSERLLEICFSPIQRGIKYNNIKYYIKSDLSIIYYEISKNKLM